MLAVLLSLGVLSFIPNIFTAFVPLTLFVSPLSLLIAPAVPFILIAYSIFLALAFFFVYQGVIVSKLGFYKALLNSFELLKKGWVPVVVAFLLKSIIAVLILAAFSIPLIALVLSVLMQGSENIVLLLVDPGLFATAFALLGVLLLGFACSKAFDLHFQTSVYKKLRGKKLLGVF